MEWDDLEANFRQVLVLRYGPLMQHWISAGVTVDKELALGTSLQTPCGTADGSKTECNTLGEGCFSFNMQLTTNLFLIYLKGYDKIP